MSIFANKYLPEALFMAKKKGINNHSKRFLNRIECSGNALPYSVCFFCLFALFVIVISWIGLRLDWVVIHPDNQEIIHIENLISRNGLHCSILEMFNDYTSFALPGILMLSLHEIGIAESNGLIITMLPYSILFFVFWPLFHIAWVYPEIPHGFDSGVHFDIPL